MKEEDYDPTAYEDLAIILHPTGNPVNEQWDFRSHNDDSTMVINWFMNYRSSHWKKNLEERNEDSKTHEIYWENWGASISKLEKISPTSVQPSYFILLTRSILKQINGRSNDSWMVLQLNYQGDKIPSFLCKRGRSYSLTRDMTSTEAAHEKRTKTRCA